MMRSREIGSRCAAVGLGGESEAVGAGRVGEATELDRARVL